MNRFNGRLMARPKDSHDAAIPSGNLVALPVLARLFRRSPDLRYRDKATETLAAFPDQIARSPGSFAYMLTAAGIKKGRLRNLEYPKPIFKSLGFQ